MNGIADEDAQSRTMNSVVTAGMATLGLSALGVVFGDIGTSPLYTLKIVLALIGGPPTPEDVLGVTGSPEAVARPRLPQNVACRFPALRSSEVGSQHSDRL